MTSYKAAGVDIDAGDALVNNIKPIAASTNRPGVMDAIGGFGALFDLQAVGMRDPLLVAATDGVGTKLHIAEAANKHDSIGIDLVAMCVNDLVVQGARPLFFLDYIATGALDVEQMSRVIEGIADGCRQAGCALVGGETAEMPGMYDGSRYDLAGFAVGAVERDGMLPNTGAMKAGDVLVGLESSGAHSNGFSLIRHVMKSRGVNMHAPCTLDASKSWVDFWLEPTRIYVRACFEAIDLGGVKGLAHITGGGLTDNLPRVLPKDLAAHIDVNSWDYPNWCTWLEENGQIERKEMYRTFNAGIGMVMVMEAGTAEQAIAAMQVQGERAQIIGELRERGDGAAVTMA